MSELRYAPRPALPAKRVGIAWSGLVLLLAATEAEAASLSLPPGVDPLPWQAAAARMGLRVVAAGAQADVSMEVGSNGWVLTVETPSGSRRVLLAPSPNDEAGREDLVALAWSLADDLVTPGHSVSAQEAASDEASVGRPTERFLASVRPTVAKATFAERPVIVPPALVLAPSRVPVPAASPDPAPGKVSSLEMPDEATQADLDTDLGSARSFHDALPAPKSGLRPWLSAGAVVSGDLSLHGELGAGADVGRHVLLGLALTMPTTGTSSEVSTPETPERIPIRGGEAPPETGSTSTDSAPSTVSEWESRVQIGWTAGSAALRPVVAATGGVVRRLESGPDGTPQTVGRGGGLLGLRYHTRSPVAFGLDFRVERDLVAQDAAGSSAAGWEGAVGLSLQAEARGR
jgi:hypothetical protein